MLREPSAAEIAVGGKEEANVYGSWCEKGPLSNDPPMLGVPLPFWLERPAPGLIVLLYGGEPRPPRLA
jgi:hypothetical protein